MSNLQRIRRERGFSQSELAARSGVNVRMIQNYEQGKNDINAAEAMTVFLLSQALDCGMRDLLEFGSESKKGER